MRPPRPCASTSALKKLPAELTTPWSKRSKSSKTNIDDLPDIQLIDIFSRLPHIKLLSRCKCVCRRWSSLISDELFLWPQTRFRGRRLAAVQRTLIFRDPNNKRGFLTMPRELDHPNIPCFEFSLRFLPCFQDPEYIETNDDHEEEPTVLGVYNDLVLCCATMFYQRDYYICNPYTKQYVQLPPCPRVYKDVRVGFICNEISPWEFLLQQKSSFFYDVDYSFAIVRIVSDDPYHSSSTYQIEIFSSETDGRWALAIVNNSSRDFCLDSLDRSGGFAYNGMLYWWSVHDDLLIGLNPYPIPHSFHSIQTPPNPSVSGRFSYLRAIGGSLRFYMTFLNLYNFPTHVSVWEYKIYDGEWRRLTNLISFYPPLLYRRIPNSQCSIVALAFQPRVHDIVYLQSFNLTCNIVETRECKEKLTIPDEKKVVRFGKVFFPFLLRSWPTPLPKFENRNTN